MGMYISIGEGTGWSASGGVFDCIVEATRGLFKEDEQCCLESIYAPLDCLLYTSPSPRDLSTSRMPSSA